MRKIDAMVAERVMGWRSRPRGRCVSKAWATPRFCCSTWGLERRRGVAVMVRVLRRCAQPSPSLLFDRNKTQPVSRGPQGNETAPRSPARPARNDLRWRLAY